VSDLVNSLKDLASSDAYSRPRMSEKDFVRFLLPLIVNVDDVKNLDMSIWLDVAGNAHRSIDVFDAANKLLFTVPPLLARVPTELPTKERSGVDISAILHLYSEKRRAEHPATADIWFESAMQGTIISMEEQNAIDYLKSWVIIYTHYNLPLAKLFGGAEVSSAGVSTAVDSAKAITTAHDDDMSGDFDDL
jgi:hypothetical protein